MELLDVRNLVKRFGGIVAINNLSFHMSKGELCGLIGPNGAGKTTLFNLVTGVYPPDSGAIFFEGEDVTKLKRYEIIKRGISRTFQLNRPFLQQTAIQNVLVGLYFSQRKALDTRLAIEEAEEILRLIGLYDKRDVLVGRLMTFERKLVELARALAAKPRLLLIDEPMAGLNPKEMEFFLNIIRRVREGGVTILMVDHIMRAVMTIAERIIVIHHGEKIAEGSPKEISRDEKVLEIYLGTEAEV